MFFVYIRDFDLPLSTTYFFVKVSLKRLIDERRDFFYPFVAYGICILFIILCNFL